MSNSASISEEASVSSETRIHDFNSLSTLITPISSQTQQPEHRTKKSRSLPGNPDPDAEVIALSPESLMATNRFVCEICNKGFQRDQNLQLHRRGHNLPWKLKQRGSKELVRKRVYVCPEESCVHHNPSRALGDLTGIKKHFCRKHGEKKWKCDKCSKKYAVHSDWKAHVKTCGTREYKCDCGNIFSRKDSFITHRAFCDALAEESARLIAAAKASSPLHHHSQTPQFLPVSFWDQVPSLVPNPNPCLNPRPTPNPNPNPGLSQLHVKHDEEPFPFLLNAYSHHHLNTPSSSYLSATALLQKACTMGSMPTMGQNGISGLELGGLSTWQNCERLTRNFLGVVDGVAGEEILPLGLELDPVIAPSCDGGDPTRPFTAFAFPPATEAWGDC